MHLIRVRLPAGESPPLPGETDSAARAGDGTLGPSRYTYFSSIEQGPTVADVQGRLIGGEPPAGGTPLHASVRRAG